MDSTLRVAEIIKDATLLGNGCDIAGSIRREVTIPTDILLVANQTSYPTLLSRLLSAGISVDTYIQDVVDTLEYIISGEYKDVSGKYRYSIYVASDESNARECLLWYYTGSDTEIRRLALEASGFGFIVNRNGLISPPSTVVANTEATIYENVNLLYRNPEDRV